MLFGRKKTEKAVLDLGFYGKLPQFADFIQYHAAHDGVRALDEWFQSGLLAIQNASTEIAEDYPELPPVHFLFHAREGGACLIGGFRTSQDKSGRRYPFAVFAVLECTPDAAWHALVPVAFDDFLGQVVALLDEATEMAGPQDVIDRVTQLAVPTPEAQSAAAESYDVFVRETTADNFMDGALPDQPLEVKQRAASRLYSLCAPLRKKMGASSPLSLRCPLAADATALFAAFWLELSFRLLAWNPPAPVAFWMPHADRPFLLGLLGRPTGRTFLHLLRDDVPDESLCDLAAPSQKPVPPEAESLPLVRQPAMSLFDVLRRADA
ncbi:MAG TPA: type VI secretion system-associated protein TagF [Polyangia bacterium]|nr:type VI secretion system-associated protein TagF [Polyangia bacterium]